MNGEVAGVVRDVPIAALRIFRHQCCLLGVVVSASCLSLFSPSCSDDSRNFVCVCWIHLVMMHVIVVGAANLVASRMCQEADTAMSE